LRIIGSDKKGLDYTCISETDCTNADNFVVDGIDCKCDDSTYSYYYLD
jgi:hypothetical protein